MIHPFAVVAALVACGQGGVPDDTTRYSLELAIDPAAGRLSISGRVVLANPRPDEPIVYLLSPALGELELVLELAGTDETRPVKSSLLASIGWGDVWKLDDVTPAPGLALRFRCTSSAGAMSMHVGEDVAYGHGDTTAWYPLFDSNGHAGHVGELAVNAPEGWTVAASGRATAPGRFRIDTPTVFSFAAGPYTTVRRAPPASGEPALAAHMLRSRPGTEAQLERLAEIVRVLAEEFGRYPFDELVVAEIPSSRAKGFFMASATQMVIVPSQYLDGELDVANFAHEITHKWWGGLAVDRGDRGSTLFTEGMAQLGALLAVERLQGADRADEMRLDGPRYVAGAYDVETCFGYKVPVQSLRGYLVLAALGEDEPLIDASHPLATSKGTLVLYLLRHTVGVERFRRAVRTFFEAHRFRDVPWEEFARTLGDAAGRDLSWFYEQWLERTGAPSFELAHREVPGGVVVTVTQAEPPYRAELEIRVAAGDRTTTHRLEITGATAEAEIAIEGRLASVELDPRRLVPRWTPSDRVEASVLASCAEAATAEQVLSQRLAGAARRPSPDGERFMLAYALGHLAAERGELDLATSRLDAALAEPAPLARLLPWVHVERARIAKKRGDAAALTRAIDAAVAADAAFGRTTGAAEAARALAGR